MTKLWLSYRTTNLWRFMITIIFFENMVIDAFLACLFNVHYLIFLFMVREYAYFYEYIWKLVYWNHSTFDTCGSRDTANVWWPLEKKGRGKCCGCSALKVKFCCHDSHRKNTPRTYELELAICKCAVFDAVWMAEQRYFMCIKLCSHSDVFCIEIRQSTYSLPASVVSANNGNTLKNRLDRF